MTTAQRYFLAIVDNQSISGAATELFVSQQNLSNFVKKLEAEYGVLFVRRPRFALTPTGEALLATVREIKIIEDGLATKVRELQKENVGKLRFGMNIGRASVFLPSVLSAYYMQYPFMQLSVVSDETRNFEQLLLKGELDLFFGVNARQLPEFSIINLGREPICFVISPFLLRHYSIGTDTQSLQPERIAAIPLITSPELSTLQQKVDAFFMQRRVITRPRVIVEDLSLQMSLVKQGIGACFCPRMMLGNDICASEGLAVISVDGMNESNELSLVYHRAAYVSQAMDGFIDIVRQKTLSIY